MRTVFGLAALVTGVITAVAVAGPAPASAGQVSAASTATSAARPPRAAGAGGTWLWLQRYHGLGSYGMPTAMTVSRDGTVFVTGYTEGGPRIEASTVAYDGATGAQLWATHYFPAKGDLSQAYAIAVSPDGSKVFVTGLIQEGRKSETENYLTVAYNATTGATLWAQTYGGTAPGYSAAASVAVSPDGATVFVTGRVVSGTYLTLAYDAATGAQLWATAGPPGEATAVAVSPDGSTLFVTGLGAVTNGWCYGTVAYNAATGAQLWASTYDKPAKQNYAQSIAVSPDGSEVFVQGDSQSPGGGAENFATVAYDTATGAMLWVHRYHNADTGANAAPSDLAVSPDGATVFVTGDATNSGDYVTLAYNATTGTKRWATAGPPGEATAVAVSPDGSTVFVTGGLGSGTDYGTVAYNAATGARRWLRRGPHSEALPPTTSVAVSPDGSEVFVTGSAETLSGRHLVYVTVAYRA